MAPRRGAHCTFLMCCRISSSSAWALRSLGSERFSNSLCTRRYRAAQRVQPASRRRRRRRRRADTRQGAGPPASPCDMAASCIHRCPPLPHQLVRVLLRELVADVAGHGARSKVFTAPLLSRFQTVYTSLEAWEGRQRDATWSMVTAFLSASAGWRGSPSRFC